MRDANELNGATAGDTIAFRLTATGDTHWIDQVRKLASTTNTPPRKVRNRQFAGVKRCL